MINLETPVKEIMSKELITVNEDSPMTSVAAIFKKHRLHHIPVVKFNTIVGMISSADYINFKGCYNTTESKYQVFRNRSTIAADIMTKGLAKLDEDDRIAIAVKLFSENIFHAIPIEKDGKLVGILTTYDLIEVLSKSVQAYAREKQKALKAIRS